ncbi:MAG: polysaccharide deacetylase family protein [Pseudolabrys sp.]|nr:polysaccharide deacetylase family protein [Pseudolabrys sp.]MBV9955380.1 polysaccharide deacetylase family protein [Pseudolabrys sp.]
MELLKKTIIRGGLEGLYFSGAHHVMRPLVGGIGAILTLHHVRPPRTDGFQPNRLLEVSPTFLERLLRRLRKSRLDLISLDEMYSRMVSGNFRRRFVCITFDDGYKDVQRYAYPLLKKYEVPFALYIPTSFPDRLGELWWIALEAVIARNSRVGLVVNGKDQFFECGSTREKRQLYNEVYAWLRSMKTEEELRRVVRDLAACHRVDIAALCDELCMTWEEIAELATDPLVTIGAHTVNHYMLKKVPSEKTVRAEMDMSRAVIEAALGKRPHHLSYPVGDPTSAGPREFQIAAELGFKTAVTTRPGVLFRKHRQHLLALPRISVNGEFQSQRYLKVLMSGAATAVWNGFRRINAA